MAKRASYARTARATHSGDHPLVSEDSLSRARFVPERTQEQQGSESLWSDSATKPIAGKDGLLWPLRADKMASSGGGGDWIARLEQGSGPVASPQVSAVDADTVRDLYDYQKDAVRKALERDGRILLAHDMGLGKTVTGLTIMNHYRGDWPLLILCPKAVLTQWAEEVARWSGRPRPPSSRARSRARARALLT